MKKFLILLLSCILVMMCLTACGEKEDDSKDDKEDKVELTLDEEETSEPTEAPTPEPTEAPTPEPTPEPTEAPTPTPEPTEAPVIGMEGVPYSVYIEDVGPEKVDVVKVLFEITGDLTKAEEYVEAAPVVVWIVKEFEAAENLCDKLAKVGCTATIRQFTNIALGERATDEMLEIFESISVHDGEEDNNDTEITIYSVYLDDAGPEFVKAIKVVREVLGLGLADAKDLIDSAPAVIFTTENENLAYKLSAELAAVGSATWIDIKEMTEGATDEPTEEATIEQGEEVEEEKAEEPAAYETTMEMPIEDTFFITSKGVVATGRIEKGTVRIGDKAVVILEDGTELSVTISGIESFRVVYEEASEGDNVGVYLDGVERKDVETATKLIIKAE